MRTDSSGRMFAAAVFFGWLFAVLSCNGFFYKNIINYEILYRGITDYWRHASMRNRTDRIVLLLLRFLEMTAVFAVTRCRHRKAGSLLLAALFSFAGGMNFVIFIWSCGLAGGILFLVSGFPQNLAYLVCLFFLLFSGWSDRPVKKDRLISMTVFLLAVGIWMELYVNPLLVKYL